MRLRICLALIVLMTTSAFAAEARIVKVLPQLLDSEGRNSIHPSLFDRDAYQLYLRENPQKVSALRFEVQYKARRADGPLTLRLEVRGSNMALGKHHVYETEVRPRGRFSKWARLDLDRATSESIGSVIAWRASLMRDGRVVAQQQSFLW